MKKSFTEHPARPEDAQAQAQAQEDTQAQAQEDAQEDAQEEWWEEPLLRWLLQTLCEVSELLKVDEELRWEWQATLDQLTPYARDTLGGLAVRGDVNLITTHRHMSHLYGLYPGAEITPSTPETFAAARKTIERRLAHGGGHTGWSRAWIINFFARLRDGNAAHDNLIALFRNSTQKNMFDTHPPFQIDGNFGGTAGITEMLLQSHDGVIDLLPALPDAWRDGRFEGLKARGGFRVSAEWKDGKVIRCAVEGRPGKPFRLRFNGKTEEAVGAYRFNGSHGVTEE